MREDNLDPLPEEELYPVPEQEPDRLPEEELDTFYEDESGAFYEEELDTFYEGEVKAFPDEESDTSPADQPGSASAAKLVAEDRLSIEPSSSVTVASKEEPLASYVATSSLAVSDGSEAAAPAPRRPMVLLAFLMVATIALVLFLKSCFATPDDASYPQVQQPTIKSVGQAVEPTTDDVDQLQAPKIKSKPPSLTPPERVVKPDVALQVLSANDNSDGQQNLVPIVVEPGLRRLIPVNAANESVSVGMPADIDQPEQDEVASVDAAVDEGRNAVSTEIVVEQRWQETMLVSFSFDSDELAPDSHGVLDRVAAILRENAKSIASITGFTDSQGDSRYNLRLSRKRADAVERYLVDAGISRERLRVVGGGVLANPIAGLVSGPDDPMEPYRIVQIKLVSEG